MNQLQILNALRINAIMAGLQDVRLIPAELAFLSRTPITSATDQEILARWLGYIQIADIVSDDGVAAVYSAGKMTFETTKIPNLKHGAMLTQEQLNQLYTLMANAQMANDLGMLSNWESNLLDALLLGVRQRMEALIIAAYTDKFTYDRLGIKASGTFGCPADLKVVPSIAWTDADNGTPIDNMLALQLTAITRYGAPFNRVTMSTACFRTMIKCAEYIAKTRQFLSPNVSYVVLSQFNLQDQTALAARVLGLQIELYDARYWSQLPDGRRVSAPFLNQNTVIMSYTGWDNNMMAMDFGNAVTTESIVSGLVPNSGMIGSLGGPTRGPIAYATAPADLNPPGITYWGVARGFPRRSLLQASGTLTVGNIVDPIPVSEPVQQ